jgi:hypothetical protein
MAIVKITELPNATTPLTGAEVTPVVQNGITVKTAISNIGVAGAYINVKTFGATGNGTTDDTAAIQACIDYVNSLGGGTVFFPAGTYYVGQLYYYPGIAFLGVGPASKLLKIPSSEKFFRMFTRQTAPVIAVDSKPVSWSYLYMDGNSANSPPYQNYQLEQQHIIILFGNENGAGRLRAFINNCVFENGTADAILVYSSVNVEISDCIMRECFRGGLVIGGGYAFVKATNVHMSGDTDLTRLDIEVDGTGGGSPGPGATFACHVELNNVYSQNGFDFGGENLTIFASNLSSDRGAMNFGGNNNLGNMNFSNCRFAVSQISGGTINRFVEVGKVNFSDCQFFFFRPAGVVGTQSFGFEIYWNVGSLNSGATINFKGCDFIADSSILSGDSAIALRSLNNYKVDNYKLIVDDCRFLGGWDVGIQNRGGFNVYKDCEIDAVTMVFQDSPSGGGGWDTTLDNLVGGPTTTTWLNVVTNDPADGIFRHKNNLVPEAYNAITTQFGFQTNIYLGGRLIQGASAPTIATPGLKGDRYILNVPVAGSIYEWVCTGYSGADVVWKAATTLAA